jgi:acyl CoA:acetate/3-ketoacid CoA transferase beta subunit
MAARAARELKDGQYVECNLPLTGAGVVNRIITDLAVLDVTADGLALRELAPGVALGELVARTAAPLRVDDAQVPVG